MSARVNAGLSMYGHLGDARAVNCGAA